MNRLICRNGNFQPGREQGAVAVLVALMLAVMMGFSALAVDLAFGFLVRNQLQHAVDAAALAGAGWLYRAGPVPAWDAARDAANAASASSQASSRW